MNKDLDFKNIGKGNPYGVPQGFFDQITQKTLIEAKRRELRRVSLRRKYWLAAVSISGVAALIVIGLFSNLEKSVLNNRINADSLSTINVTIQSSQLGSDRSKDTHDVSKVISSTIGKNEIDKLLSTLSDEEINLLADISTSDVFFDQTQQ